MFKSQKEKSAAKVMTPDREVSDHAARARLAKKQAAEAMGIDAGFISEMVEGFYGRIRKDDMLGPIFAKRIKDWPAHLGRMKDFWASVLHNSGSFSGNPMVKHIAIPDIGRAHFAHWLDLFDINLTAMDPSEEAHAHVHERARMIANSLMNGIAIQRDGMSGARKVEEF